MKQSEASTAIFERFRTMWIAAQSTIPFVFDNDIAPEAETFARCGLLNLDSEQWTLGPPSVRKWMRKGYIDIRITTAIDIGRLTADGLVETVRDIFEGKRFAQSGDLSEYGITTHATSVSDLKRDREATQLWVVQTLTPYEFYETR